MCFLFSCRKVNLKSAFRIPNSELFFTFAAGKSGDFPFHAEMKTFVLTSKQKEKTY